MKSNAQIGTSNKNATELQKLLKIDFDGHLVGGDFATFGGYCWEWNRVNNDVHTH